MSEDPGKYEGQVVKVGEMKISIYSNNAVNVSGFPTNLHATLAWMAAALDVIASHFVRQAREGNVDEKGQISMPRITVASPIDLSKLNIKGGKH